MKIAIYVYSWPPGRHANGIITYTAQLVPALRRLGHEVFVLTWHPNENSADEYTIDLNKVSLSMSDRLWARGLGSFSPSVTNYENASRVLSTAIRQLVEQTGIDIFEMEESFGWTYPVAKLDIVPVVVRLHGPWSKTGQFTNPKEVAPNNVGRAEREGRAIAAAHYVTANCNETLNAVKAHYGLGLHDSCVIPTPLDPVPENEMWTRDTCEKDTILFVGRFDSLKGGDLVLRVFAKLAETNPHLTLTFIGPDIGLSIDGKKLQFEEFVRENFVDALRPRIKFHGHMSHAELMSMRSKHFLTVIAAQYDTMGYMLLEPMSFGCPLVATSVGGIPEVIKDEHNGILVASQDESAMTNACQRLLDDHSLAARIGKQAWLDCRELYGSEPVARKTIAAYCEAIALFQSTRK